MAKSNFHESYAEHEQVKGPSNRNFGFTVGGIFAAIGAVKAVFFSVSWLSLVFLALGGGLIAAAALVPHRLTRLNAAWMGLAKLLFHIVNPVIMFLLFCVAFVPAAAIMKLVQYDPMKRRFDSAAKTYWVTKEKTGIDKPMRYQF